MTDWRLTLRKQVRIPAMALTLAAALGGCSLFGEPNEVVATCPTTGILADGERLERYRDVPVRDITDLLLRARIGNLRNGCSIKREERLLLMDLMLDVLVERGPAAAVGEPVRLTYFVAVIGKNDTILSREEYPLEARFSSSARQASFTEALFLTVPIPPDQAVDDFNVVVSLQLTPDELERARLEQ